MSDVFPVFSGEIFGSILAIEATMAFSLKSVWILFIAFFTIVAYHTFKGRVTGEEHGY